MNRWFPARSRPCKIRSTPVPQIVVADAAGHPTQHLERQHMPLEERLGGLAGKRHMQSPCPRRPDRRTNRHTVVKVPSSQTHSSPKSTSASSPTRWTCGTVTHPTPPVSSRRSPGDLAANGRPSPTRHRSRRPAAASIGRAVCRCLLGEHLVGGHPRGDQRLPSAHAPAPLVPNGSAPAAPRSAALGGPYADAPGRSGPRHKYPSLGGGHPGGYARTAPPSTSLLPCSAGVVTAKPRG